MEQVTFRALAGSEPAVGGCWVPGARGGEGGERRSAVFGKQISKKTKAAKSAGFSGHTVHLLKQPTSRHKAEALNSQRIWIRQNMLSDQWELFG